VLIVDFITDQDLQDYASGRLDDERREAVEALLADDSVAAERVRQYATQDRLLTELAGLVDPRAPDRLRRVVEQGRRALPGLHAAGGKGSREA